MNKKIATLAIAAIATVALSAGAMAYGGNHGGGHMGGGNHGGYHGGGMMGSGMMGGGCGGNGPGMRGNALTPEQQQKATELFTAFQAKTETLRQELYAKNAMLQAHLAAVKPDASKVDSLTKEVAELRTKMFTEQIALRKAQAEAGLPAHGWGHRNRAAN